MFKNQKICFFIFLVTLLAVPLFFVQAAPLSSSQTYKGIVKIYTYYEDSDYFLNPLSSGSGVIISQDGYVLTNYHVVTVTDSLYNEMDSAFKICLTESTTESPSCEYTANLVAKDENRDIAILKIKNINGVSLKSTFDYIPLGDTSDVAEGDATKALGYPGIGGDTITITSGTVSGTTVKYSSSWIKTDTPFSFGSSGGALVDDAGELIGITTSAYADLLGSLGYVIDINSIKGWIEQNQTGEGEASRLQPRMNNLISEQKELESKNKFVNNLPYLEVEKPSDWTFDYAGENAIKIEDQDSNDKSALSLNWTLTPYADSAPIVEAAADMLSDQGLYIKEGEIQAGGRTGQKIVLNMAGEEVHQILLSSKNYMVVISYYYGEDDGSKDQIDQIINSIVLSDQGNNYTEKRYYEHSDPYFRLNVTKDWALQTNNSLLQPLNGMHTNDPYFEFILKIEELSPSMQTMDNEAYFNYVKGNDELAVSDSGYKPQRYFESTNYKINDELNDEIFYKYRYIDEDDGDQVKSFSAGFRILNGDNAIVISFENYGKDEALFEQYLKEFQDNELALLSLGRSVSNNEIETGDSIDANDQAEEDSLLSSIKNITSSWGRNLKGRILLQVEQNGEAWYLSPGEDKAYFLGRPEDAFQVMREQGMGIMTVNLEKIPIGLSNLTGEDTDGDGLPDIFEDAIGTDKEKVDTDGDGYNDYDEVRDGYDPRKVGAKMNIDKNYANSHKGKIFLQVQDNGEAWYINPVDGKRYFLGRPADAFQVMRNLGLGISNENFENL